MARPLAAAALSIFYLSSYDTDFLLVAEEDLLRARRVLASHFTVLDISGQNTDPISIPVALAAPSTLGARVRRVLAVDRRPLHLIGLAPASLVAAAGALLQLVLWPSTAQGFLALCVTGERVSIVCDDAAVQVVQSVVGDAVLSYSTTFVRVHGHSEEQLGFDEPGIVDALARPLAQAQVPIFQISSFSTEHTLIARGDLPRALAALKSDGYVLEE